MKGGSYLFYFNQRIILCNIFIAKLLSRIKLENYETENTLGIHTRHKMTNEYGDPYTYDSVKKLTFADFLGITGIGKNKAGALVNMPEAFQAFTNMFAMEYDRIKGELVNPDGSPVDLESYLKMVHAYGEFDNKMDKPVLEFVSGLLDIIFIKPLAEICIGHDLITGEDLGDFERGMKGVFAVVDVASMLVGIKASGAVKLFSKGSLQLAGKTTLVGAMSYAAAYGTGKLGEELGLPWPVTLLLSLGAGVAVAKVGSKYVFKDGTGKILLEADVDEVDALRRLDNSKAAKGGVGEIDFAGSIKNLNKIDNAYDAIRNSPDDIARVSQNTGMPEWKIKRLKDHIFNRDQLLEDGIKRIDPDVEMATAWQRVASGGFDPDDISRLNHEHLEATGNRLLGAGGAKWETKKSYSADDANKWWKDQMEYDNSPYKTGTTVKEVTLTQEVKFVRVYDGTSSRQAGGWVMKAEDIKGLTPTQIQDKFALPTTPKYVTDVTIPKGTTIRTGTVNPVEGWGNGGGTQFDLMGQRIGKFTNERLL